MPDPGAGRDLGPRLLAKHLDTFCGQIDRAREFGLVPDPDRPGGRVSAAQAEDIRARWPEIEAAATCIGTPGLAKRGWTRAMVRDTLGEPDTTAADPYHKGGGPRRLWRLERVLAAEATPEFAVRRERAIKDGRTAG